MLNSRGASRLCLMLLALTACSTGPELDLSVHESSRAAIYLERMADRSLKAAHPIKLNAELISKVLSGIFVREEQGALQTLVAGKASELRAFSDDDVAYLTPFVMEGLAQAAPDQQVTFRVTQAAVVTSPKILGTEASKKKVHFSTGGSIYAYGRSLYVTLRQYRHQVDSVTTIVPQRGIPDTTGLAHHKVLFYPEAAQRPDHYLDGQPSASTLVIDYESLGLLPSRQAPTVTAQPDPSPPPKPATSIMPAQPAPEPTKRDAEIEALRKELQDIKRRLAEQEAQRSQGPR